MRLNFTGRRKIDRQHVGLRVLAEGGFYFFEIELALQHYPMLPPDGRVFLEAYQKLVLMRFDLGCIGKLNQLAPTQRRLTDFGNPEGVKFRLKVTQPDGTESGKLLAEADGLRPEQGAEGRTSLIQLEGADDLGQRPWKLDLVPTDPDLPTLRINNAIGGKMLGYDPTFRSLVLPAVVQEVFTQLVRQGTQEDDPDHWVSLWRRLAVDVLKQSDPSTLSSELSEDGRTWISNATLAFCNERRLADRYSSAHADGGVQ